MTPTTASAHSPAVSDPVRRPQVSVVIPVYKSKECLPELYRRLVMALESITESFELVLIEDGGNDGSWEEIASLASSDPRVKGIKLSRNFGQHCAITAGLDHAAGEWVVVMDCDLQDQPEEIAGLYRKALDGYDVVLAIREERREAPMRRLAGRVFYRLLQLLTKFRWDPRVGTFRIMSAKAVRNFCLMREQLRFFGGMVQWLGFNTAEVPVAHAQRFAGRSTYSLRALVRLAVSACLSFSERPLYFSVFVGLAISVGAFLYGVYVTYRKLVHGIPVEGWTSVIVSVYFLSGLILFNLGIVGLYIGRIFVEMKRRPIYVVEQGIGI